MLDNIEPTPHETSSSIISRNSARPLAALYGRNKGKALNAAAHERMGRLLPALKLDLRKPIVEPATLFSQPVKEIWCEIGFGGGEHLAHIASLHGDIGFFGCEPFFGGVSKLTQEIEERGLSNIRIHDHNAVDLLTALPDASLSRLYLLYPDPWPKRKQNKRRFISEGTLALLAQKLKSGAEFRMATDIDHYAGWTLSRIAENPDFIWLAENAADWIEPWEQWHRTRYEEKAIREGRRPSYLRFLRR